VKVLFKASYWKDKTKGMHMKLWCWRETVAISISWKIFRVSSTRWWVKSL